MKLEKQIGVLPKKNHQISLAVRYKFFFLLFLSLALIFDLTVRPPRSTLFDRQPPSQMPAAK